jgi:hypothetical protein
MGFSAVLTTEHDESLDDDRWKGYRQACAEVSTCRIVVVPGVEYSDASNTVHMLVWGDRMPFLGARKDTDLLLRDVRHLGGLAVLAHPTRKDAWERFDVTWAPFLLGIEQWNRKVDGIAPSREAAALLRMMSGLVPFVGLDFHRWNQFYPLSMGLRVDGNLSEKTVLMALRDRRAIANAYGISLRRFTTGRCNKAVTAAEHFRRRLRKCFKGNGRDSK